MRTQTFFPKWAANLASLYSTKSLVRSQCYCCGIQQRVDLPAKIAHLGPGASLIDRAERCSIVGCQGQLFFLCATTYGRQWIPLVSEGLRLVSKAPATNAVTMERDRRAKRK